MSFRRYTDANPQGTRTFLFVGFYESFRQLKSPTSRAKELIFSD